jgi:DNA-binding MarR family transcriptional regulator
VAAPSDDPERVAARAVLMMGRDAERTWTDEDALAWEGMLELSRRLRRRAEELLTRDDDLSVSMLGIMGRLVRAEDMTLRQTALAEATGLSVSRVSRIIDMLAERGLVERHTCPTDARATDIAVTARGRERTARAQHRLFAFVEASFSGRLSPDERATLARVFARLLIDR